MKRPTPRIRPGVRNSIRFALIGLGCTLLALGTGCVSTAVEDRTPADSKEAKRLSAFNCNLAERFWEQERPDLSLRYLEMAVRQNPEDPAPRLKILDLYLASGNPEAALQYLEECPEELRTNTAFLKRRALAYELTDRGEEAVKLLDDAAAHELEDRELIAAAVESLLVLGDNPEALGLLEQASKRFPEEEAFLDALGDLYRMLGFPRKEAECHLKLFLLRDDGALHLRRAARAFARGGALDEGLERITAMAKRSGSADQGAVTASLGYLYYLKGDHERAAPLLERALGAPDFEPEREEILALAEIRMRRQDYGGAACLLERRLNEDPGDVLIRAALAWAYHCSGSSVLSRKLIAESPGLMETGGILQALKERIER